MIYLRSFIYNILYFGLLGLGCIIVSILFFIPESWNVKFWNYGIVRINRFLLRVICGIKIEIRGQEFISQQGVIYAAKHESSLETYIMTAYLTRAVVILKKELTKIPVFGWAVHLYGMIKVDRGSGSVAMKQMLTESKKALDRQRPIIIFPEGTRRKPGAKPEYKPGIYFMESNLHVPVIPVALNTGLFWKKNSFLRYPGTVVIEFMAPMPTGLSKKEFMDELEFRIENKCKELNNEAIQKYPYVAPMMEKNSDV